MNNYRKIEYLIFAFVLTSIKIIFGGYTFGTSDLTAHLIPILRRLDPLFLVNDFFANYSIEFGPTYYYSIFIAYIAKYIPLDYLFLFSTFLTHYIIIIISILTARKFFNSSHLTSLIFALLVLNIDPFNLGGGGWLTDSYFKPAYFVRIFCYSAIFFIIIRKPIIGFLLISIGLLFHPTIALETTFFIYLIYITDKIFALKKSETFSIKNLFKNCYDIIFPSIIFLAFILFFWVLPYISSNQLSNSKFLEIFLFRTYYDTVPSYFYYKGYLYAFVFFILSYICYNWHKKDLNKARALFIIKYITVAVFAFCLLGYIFVEIIPTRFGASLMTFRMLYIIKWFALLMVVSLIMESFNQSKDDHPIKRLWILSINYFKKSLPIYIPSFIVNFIFFICLYFILYPSILVYTNNMALPILFSSIYLLWFTSLNNKLALTTPIIVIMILSVDIVNPILPLPNKIKSYYPIIEQYHDIYDYGGKDIADFSKANTSKDAIFLVPPNFGSFRGAAQRAIVVDRKCILFNDKGLLEWWNRINDCYGKVNVLSNYDEQRQMLSSNYNRISNEKINFLKNKYNISYAILDINTEIGFKMIFKDDQYKLIKID